MTKPAASLTLRVIDILIGGFVEFCLLTVGLFVTLYSFDMMNRAIWVLIYYFLALVWGALFIIGGIGVIRRRGRSRIYLNVTWGISILFMAFYIFSELKLGFSTGGIGSEFFDIGPWLGGIIFWSAAAVLGILHIRFLNSRKVKELFI